MSVTATPEQQQALLVVQDIDTRLLQVQHRRRSLPERDALMALEVEMAQTRDLVIAAEVEVSDLQGEQRKADNDVEAVRSRRDRDQARLDSGSGTAKELEGLQHEIQSLARRQAELEDIELEIMERLEGASASLTQLREKAERLAADRHEVQARLDAADAALQGEAEQLAAQRATAVAGVPADLLALYDKIRADRGGVGAAALHRGQCQGCRIALNATEISRIREAAPDTVLRCEECRAILVRTPESGL